MEWFESIGQWFVDNKEAIVMFVTSGNFVGFIANIALLIKAIFGIKTNTSSTNALTETFKEHKELKEGVSKISNDNESLKSEVTTLKEEITELKTQNELLLSKLSAMLDVQSLVYATIKDEPTRVAVLNILANAKYSETTQRNKLKEELVALQEELMKNTNKTVEQVTEAVEKATAIVENTPQRY